MTAPDPVPLPDGTRLVHIGPHKTGTTSVQGAFHRARQSAAAQGVHYAGPNRHPRQAAQAAATRSLGGRHWGSMRAWDGLVREVRRARGRVVISSEWFADARPQDIDRLIRDLDADRVHVVVTLRPLASILASQWQQFVQGGITMPYQPWLQAVFDEPFSGTGRRFWHRHRHDQLIERWAAVVGRERLTAVVVDDREHSAVLRVFERLAGLSEGTLELVPDRANRSLIRSEAELVRAINGAFTGAGIDGPLRLDLVLFGAAASLKVRGPGRDEPRIETPAWALERAAVAADEIVEGIRRSGVRVVGELDQLRGGRPAANSVQPPVAAERERAGLEAAWPQIAAAGAIGVLTAAGLARSGDRASAVGAFSTQRLRSILVGRLRDALPPIARMWRRRRAPAAVERTGIAAP